MTTVSVVIPLYNKARHIRRALDSVLAQSVRDFEILVVDDGSTDGGADVVRQLNDPRIRLIQQQNSGVSAARNRGIHEVSSDKIAFLDADDEWLPGHLETVIGLTERHPEAGLYATAYRFCRDGVMWRPAFPDCVESPEGGLLADYFRAASIPEPVWTSTVMMPANIFEQVGGFSVGVHGGEDMEMWARVAVRYPIAWSPSDGAIYHLSADNRLSHANPVAADVAEAVFIEDFLRSEAESVTPRRSIEEYLVSRRLPLALECYLRGRKSSARELLTKSQGTVRFRRRRSFLRFAFIFPPTVLILARRMKGVARRLTSHTRTSQWRT